MLGAEHAYNMDCQMQNQNKGTDYVSKYIGAKPAKPTFIHQRRLLEYENHADNMDYVFAIRHMDTNDDKEDIKAEVMQRNTNTVNGT